MSTRKTHKPGRPSGRVVFDDRGNASWGWSGEAGGFEDEIDTHQLKAIGADLDCEGGRAANAPLHDPYNRTIAPRSDPSRPKRRSLDDLRKLSEEIKSSRHWKDPRSR